MLIGRYGEHGKPHFERVPDLPEDYNCPEWAAYNAAFDRAKETGEDWNQELEETFGAYLMAAQTRSNEEEEEEPVQESAGGFFGWLFGR